MSWHPRNPAFLLDGRQAWRKRRKSKPHHSSSPCNQSSSNPVTLTTLANSQHQPSWPYVTTALLVGKTPLLGVCRAPGPEPLFRWAPPKEKKGVTCRGGGTAMRGGRGGFSVVGGRLQMYFSGDGSAHLCSENFLLSGHHQSHPGSTG